MSSRGANFTACVVSTNRDNSNPCFTRVVHRCRRQLDQASSCPLVTTQWCEKSCYNQQREDSQSQPRHMSQVVVTTIEQGGKVIQGDDLPDPKICPIDKGV